MTAPFCNPEIVEVFSDAGAVIAAPSGSLTDGAAGAQAGILAPDVAPFAAQSISGPGGRH